MSITERPINFNFLKLERDVDLTVIELVSILGIKEVSTIKEAKDVIVNTLLNNPESYSDYNDDNFRIMSILYFYQQLFY
jgi:hypothetical protein